MFYNVKILKASLSNILMGKNLHFVVKNDRFDMKASRKKVNEKFKRFEFKWDQALSPSPKYYEWDTILGLTAAKKFTSSSPDDDYGISGLGGACGYKQGYK